MPTTFAYGDHPDQHATLHLPVGERPHPTVVVLHGGFWLARYDAGLMAQVARDLVARGYAVWNAEYRRLGAGGGWPATFEDAAAALDLLGAVADDHHPLDLTHPVAVGHSAGGHLAAWLAARPGLPADAPGADPVVRLAGVVCQAGVLDLEAAARQRVGGRSVQRLLGGEPDAVPHRYDLASPVRRLPTGVPSVAVHGRGDGIVPAGQSSAYVEAARRAGDEAELVLVDDADHFGHLDPGSPLWAASVEALGRLRAAP